MAIVATRAPRRHNSGPIEGSRRTPRRDQAPVLQRVVEVLDEREERHFSAPAVSAAPRDHGEEVAAILGRCRDVDEPRVPLVTCQASLRQLNAQPHDRTLLFASLLFFTFPLTQPVTLALSLP